MAGTPMRVGTEGGIQRLRRSQFGMWNMASPPIDGSLVGRALTKRHVGGGAIAGIVVGAVVGVALLLLCLYPFIVRRVKRCRGATRAPFDPEAAIAAAKTGKPEETVIDRGHRVSSSSSLRQNAVLTRGTRVDERNGDLEWATPRGIYTQSTPSRLGSSHGYVHDQADHYRIQADPFPQLGCYDGEFAPAISEDDQPGMLKGTSADYYSPSIPSEAFGMTTEPESIPDLDTPTRQSSHGSSFRHHVMSMFRHKSSRDQTINSISQSIAEESSPPAAVPRIQPVPLQPIITDGGHVDSPASISQTSLNIPAPQAPSKAEDARRPLEASLLPRRLHAAPSPPLNPAPGTVNPMDIMPASTESEHWHRTEHELLSSSYELSPGKPYIMSAPANDSMMQASPPTGPHIENQALPLLTTTDASAEHIPEPHGHIIVTPDARNASCPSEQSTPFLGHGFTDVSSQNTPSTQLDTPTPESGGSSDYRLSSSPQPGRSKNGAYHCDEPGCTQVFDQPHKLKHHQRYHSKDHKCLYPGCGKGFGTKTHLQRHINDRHEKTRKFHCSVAECDYSRNGGKGFPRKDNWKRHMMKKHGMDQSQLLEPIEADLEMSGT